METCNEIEDYKSKMFDNKYSYILRDIECEKDFNNHKDIKYAKEVFESYDKIPKNEDDFFKKMEDDSNGCGSEGLYGCPVHPQLDLIREEAIKIALKKFKKQYNMDHIPTESLIEEIRNRQLAEPLDGTVSVSSNGTVNFSIKTLSWPTGVYDVKIMFVSEKKNLLKKDNLKMTGDASSELRLPLDLLMVLDVETLEEALVSEWAIEYECEIKFCKNSDELSTVLEELEGGVKYYKIDEIEFDRIQAIIDLLNKAEEDPILGHLLDRIVR